MLYLLNSQSKVAIINILICPMQYVQSSFSVLIVQALNLSILWVRDQYSVSEKTASAGNGRWPKVKNLNVFTQHIAAQYLNTVATMMQIICT